MKINTNNKIETQYNKTQVNDKTKTKGLKIKTRVKAGGITINHNETLIRERAKELKVKSHVKARAINVNHNQTLVRNGA